MTKRLSVIALLALVVGLAAQTASADPVKAKNSSPILTVVCGSTVYHVVGSPGSGDFTPAHVVDSSAVFVPVTLDLTFTFTPTGGSPQSEHDVSIKPNAPANGKVLSCTLPLGPNTFVTPDGTFSISGSVTAFIA